VHDHVTIRKALQLEEGEGEKKVRPVGQGIIILRQKRQKEKTARGKIIWRCMASEGGKKEREEKRNLARRKSTRKKQRKKGGGKKGRRISQETKNPRQSKRKTNKQENAYRDFLFPWR